MKILREPLLHFLLLGAAIFAAYSILSRDSFRKPDEIVVTQGKIENLGTTFARTLQRPPTEQELQGLIRDNVREEVAYREALALGLDQDDTIVRRRLRQKLEFISDDFAAQVEPTDAELQTYLNSHADDFRSEPRFTFRQVYLNPDKRGSNLDRDAKRILAELRHNEPDTHTLGDSTLLEPEFVNVTASDVNRMFGEPFAAVLSALKPGEWQGSIESGYGVHLVFVAERTEGYVPALEEVRDAVRRDWANEKRMEANEKFYQALLQQYTVTIEPPKEKELAGVR
jgi:hypothetical protein